jgi:hypothetical protein
MNEGENTMPHIKEITVNGSYTWQPAPYHAINGGMSVTMELEDGDDLQEAKREADEIILQCIVETLAGVDHVHTELTLQGKTPADLLAEDSDMLEADDSDDFDMEDWDTGDEND